MRRASGLLMQRQLHNSWQAPGGATALKHTFSEAPTLRHVHTHTHTHGCYGNTHTQLSRASDHTPVNRQIHTNELIYSDELMLTNTLSPFLALSLTQTDMSKLALELHMEKWWHMGNIKPFKLKQLMWLCSVNERCHHLIRHGYTGTWGTALSSRCTITAICVLQCSFLN